MRVWEGNLGIDTVWRLRTETTDGVRSWDAGCLNADAFENALRGVEWRDGHTLEVTTDDGRVLTVPVDARTGRPARRVEVGFC
ncbi:hypothetical protein GCM10025868_09220 [Angustibacter aerolatus]|uniref:Uncharacterized protein n=1 Tax=Angustibacter aerolatus TaxID=1162965 RepID=A0ABQ6JD27_9ACTN|nr:hypothetical protein GCM10025868_09220 [Angustibacter aerolatus]